MIRLMLHCVPAEGRRDLAWLARLVGRLDVLYTFLLRAEFGAQLAEDQDHRAWATDEVEQVVNGRMTELGSPVVSIRDDTTVIELAVPVLTTVLPIHVLASFALLFKWGPELASWPCHVKQTWFSADGESAEARQAYGWIRHSAIVEVVDVLDERALPKPAGRRIAKKGKRRSELPAGVRRSPPLDAG